MKVLVIIVTYNGRKWMDKCLGSLRTSTVRPDVYIIDNGSTDGTQEYIKRNFPEVIFHQSKENLGFGKANNLGLQYALDNDYDYVYLLNQDAWIFSDTIELLIKTQKEHPEYGIVSPIQMQANNCHMDTSFLNAALNTPEYLDDLYAAKRGKVYSQRLIMAAHWLITSSCLKAVGGFSPTFPHYGEDNNYASRALFHGFNVGFTDITSAIHDRENRKITLEMKLYFYYITLLVNFSDVNIRRDSIIIPMIVEMFKLSIKNNTIRPFLYMIKFMSRLLGIQKNYKISKEWDCAFLSK